MELATLAKASLGAMPPRAHNHAVAIEPFTVEVPQRAHFGALGPWPHSSGRWGIPMNLDDLPDLDIDDDDLADARRFNGLLAVLPRFHTCRRWNARLGQTLLGVNRLLPDLRRGLRM